MYVGGRHTRIYGYIGGSLGISIYIGGSLGIYIHIGGRQGGLAIVETAARSTEMRPCPARYICIICIICI